MIKEEINYIDYNGNPRTWCAYFNLNKPEIIKLQTSVDGGYDELIKKIINSENTGEIIGLFEKILHISYGRKSQDGTRFEKSEALWEEFTQSPAYDELYMKLIQDADYAAKFIEGVLPKDFVANQQALPNS